jgi:phosphoketolase
VEGTWRSHQVPLSAVRDNPDHLRQLEAWLRSYRPEELFDEHGSPRPEDARLRHHDWIRFHGTDRPEVADWPWDG